MNQKLKISKLVLGIIEIVLAISFIRDGVLEEANLGVPVFLTAHIVVAVLCKKSGNRAAGNILGAVANGVAVIPLLGFAGMIMHTLAGIFIMVEMVTLPKEESSTKSKPFSKEEKTLKNTSDSVTVLEVESDVTQIEVVSNTTQIELETDVTLVEENSDVTELEVVSDITQIEVESNTTQIELESDVTQIEKDSDTTQNNEGNK